jgi:hypothetical protein
MNNNHDDTKMGPDDIARIAAEQIEIRKAAWGTFNDMGRVQRLAANRSPQELKDAVVAHLNALAAQHTVAIRIIESNITDAAGALVDGGELEEALGEIGAYTSDRERLCMAREVVGSVYCGYPAPSPEDLEEFLFSSFQQPNPETEEAGE